MIELDDFGGLVFGPEDLKEVYEPIVTQFGFQYEECLDKHKTGLVWTKFYEGHEDYLHLCPAIVIRETGEDPISNRMNAHFFSTDLWWEDMSNPGFMLGVNPNEFDDGSGDELETFILLAKLARKEANTVLEECRKLLVTKLDEIRTQLIEERKKVVAND